MMTNIKSIILTLMVFLGSVPNLSAQSQKMLKLLSDENILEKATMMMQEKYQLTSDQYKKVMSINASFAEKAKPIVFSNQNEISKVLALKPLANERENSLKKIFTDKQWKIYNDFKKERQSLMKAWLEN